MKYVQHLILSINHIVLLVASCTLVACASTSKTDSKVSSLEVPGTYSSKEIKEDLLRTGESWGYYAVDATPITSALRQAQMRETGLDDGADGEAVTLRMNAAKNANSRVCFEIKLHTLGVYENDLNRWKFIFSNPGSGEAQTLLFENTDGFRELKSDASYFYKYSSHAIACAYGNIRLMSGLNIYAIPPDGWTLSATPQMLTWNFK
jgi:hypothetical protein